MRKKIIIQDPLTTIIQPQQTIGAFLHTLEEDLLELNQLLSEILVVSLQEKLHH
jgi:hypothetical protein